MREKREACLHAIKDHIRAEPRNENTQWKKVNKSPGDPQTSRQNATHRGKSQIEIQRGRGRGGERDTTDGNALKQTNIASLFFFLTKRSLTTQKNTERKKRRQTDRHAVTKRQSLSILAGAIIPSPFFTKRSHAFSAD